MREQHSEMGVRTARRNRQGEPWEGTQEGDRKKCAEIETVRGKNRIM